MREVTEYFDKKTGGKVSYEEVQEKFGKSIVGKVSYEEVQEKFGKSIVDNQKEWESWLETNYDVRDRFIETPYERTRRQVYATGNRWAIENFNATH